MNNTIRVNERGTMTLPKKLRTKLGLDKGGLVIAEETDQGIVLRAAAAYPIEIYTDERIREFEEDEAEAAAFLESLKGKQ